MTSIARVRPAIALGLQQEPGVFNTLVGELPINQSVRNTSRPHLWLIPGDKRTATAQAVLAAEQRGDVLNAVTEFFVKPFNGKPDIIVFDTAPSVGGLQESAMFAASLVIVPAACDHLALFGVTGVLQTLATLRKRGWNAPALILPTFYDDVTKQSREHLATLNARLTELGHTVLAPIHRATDLRESVSVGQTIFEYAPNTRAAQEYADLVWKILEA